MVSGEARRRQDQPLIPRAVEVICWMLERGWDAKKGGLFLGIDTNGGTPWCDGRAALAGAEVGAAGLQAEIEVSTSAYIGPLKIE